MKGSRSWRMKVSSPSPEIKMSENVRKGRRCLIKEFVYFDLNDEEGGERVRRISVAPHFILFSLIEDK